MEARNIDIIPVNIVHARRSSPPAALAKTTDVFVFLSTLFLGADIIGFDIFGLNVRLVQLFLVVASILLIAEKAYSTKTNFWIKGLTVLSVISSLFSISLLRSIAFSLSLIFNVFFVFCLYSSYLKSRGTTAFMRVLRISFYVQAILLVFQFLIKVAFDAELPFLPSYGVYLGIHRFCLWFYEPSYLATYFVIWYAFSLFMLLFGKKRLYIVDVLLCLTSFVIATSTTGFIGLAAVTAIVFLLYFFHDFRWKKIVILGLAIVAFVVLINVFHDIFDVFVARLFSNDLNGASGGRIARWSETLNVFLDKPFFGVGPGCYGLYVANDTAVVPSNITLELLATFGFLGPFFFYGLTVVLSFRSIKVGIKRGQPILVGMAIGLLAFTLMLQVNQGYLRLYHWMVFGCISGATQYYEELAAKKNRIYRYLRESQSIALQL